MHLKGAVTLILISVLLSGCAANLNSNNKFTRFGTPPDGKSLVYLIRNKNFMASQKRAYMYVSSAKSDGNEKAIENYVLLAAIAHEMYVPIVHEPGTFLFKTGMKTEVTLKPDSITCLDVGSRSRGIVSILTVEELSMDDCKKDINDKYEGVQLEEAQKRIGEKGKFSHSINQS
jgi:hypothetical protein